MIISCAYKYSELHPIFIVVVESFERIDVINKDIFVPQNIGKGNQRGISLAMNAFAKNKFAFTKGLKHLQVFKMFLHVFSFPNFTDLWLMIISCAYKYNELPLIFIVIMEPFELVDVIYKV